MQLLTLLFGGGGDDNFLSGFLAFIVGLFRGLLGLLGIPLSILLIALISMGCISTGGATLGVPGTDLSAHVEWDADLFSTDITKATIKETTLTVPVLARLELLEVVDVLGFLKPAEASPPPG